MDVVPDRGSVPRVEIGAVNGKNPARLDRRLDGERNDMCFRLMPLADLAVGIASGRVEIPEHDRVEAMCRPKDRSPFAL